MNIEQLLDREIESEFSNLEKVEMGSEPYKIAVDGLCKLVDRKIELKKIDNDVKDKTTNRETDSKFKTKQIDNEKADRMISNGIAIAGIVIPAVLTVWGTFKTLKFEETGTVTTMMGRGFVNKLLPRK